MGWNPQFNFSLRDDEVTFGELIFDKQCADMLCAELLKIKNGSSSDISNIKSILDAGCFTDEELSDTRWEFEQIKEDIKVFSEYLRTYQKFATWWDTTATKASYIVGSTTWYQQFIDIKSMAADMYMKLLNSNHQFSPEDKGEYDRRYRDIIQSTSANERTELAIRRQYERNLAEGVDNAREIYMDAMITAGFLTEEQVEAQNVLLRAADTSNVAVTMKPLEEGEVRVDYDLLHNMWLDLIHADCDSKAVAEASTELVGRISKVLTDIGLEKYTKSLESCKNLLKYQDYDAYIESITEWFELLNTPDAITAFNNADVRWLEEDIKELKQILRLAISSTSGNFKTVVDTALINSVYNEIKEIYDRMQRATAEIRFVKEVTGILTEAGIMINSNWNKVCEDFVTQGNIPAGEVHKQADAVINCVNYASNTALIDSLGYEVDYDWADLFRKHK